MRQVADRAVAGATQPHLPHTASDQGIPGRCCTDVRQPPLSALARAVNGRPPPVRAGLVSLRQAVSKNTATDAEPRVRQEEKAEGSEAALCCTGCCSQQMVHQQY